ncbi:MAG: ceramidase domain-containing protein [Methyloceanibacter sp.]|uniref:ceramidase domain-containing protein n=1 Tax=Methyloceanibacter sp. TaxID=1965321 RepID=UPI003D6CC814
MTFGEHVFLYCERGTNAALWAEPINAISNAGFFLAALIAWQVLLWRPRETRNADHFLLIGLVFLIGFGSLAFHVYADEGTALADVVPISVFMLVYLGFALNRFLGVPPGWTVLLVIGFAALIALAGQVQCWEGGVGVAGADVTGAKPCLNGSVGYLPALAALIVVGMLLAERHHRAAPYVLWAAVVFTVSILLRSLDMAFCDQVVIDGRKVGTHFIWHLLNALVLFLLLRASFEAGAAELVHAEPEPEEEATAPAVAPVEMVPAKSEPKETPEVSSAGQEAVVKAEAPAELAPGEEPEDDVSEEEPKDVIHEAAKGEAEPKPAETETTAGSKSKSKKKPFFPA